MSTKQGFQQYLTTRGLVVLKVDNGELNIIRGTNFGLSAEKLAEVHRDGDADSWNLTASQKRRYLRDHVRFDNIYQMLTDTVSANLCPNSDVALEAIFHTKWSDRERHAVVKETDKYEVGDRVYMLFKRDGRNINVKAVIATRKFFDDNVFLVDREIELTDDQDEQKFRTLELTCLCAGDENDLHTLLASVIFDAGAMKASKQARYTQFFVKPFPLGGISNDETEDDLLDPAYLARAYKDARVLISYGFEPYPESSMWSVGANDAIGMARLRTLRKDTENDMTWGRDFPFESVCKISGPGQCKR